MKVDKGLVKYFLLFCGVLLFVFLLLYTAWNFFSDRADTHACHVRWARQACELKGFEYVDYYGGEMYRGLDPIPLHNYAICLGDNIRFDVLIPRDVLRECYGGPEI